MKLHYVRDRRFWRRNPNEDKILAIGSLTTYSSWPLLLCKSSLVNLWPCLPSCQSNRSKWKVVSMISELVSLTLFLFGTAISFYLIGRWQDRQWRIKTYSFLFTKPEVFGDKPE